MDFPLVHVGVHCAPNSTFFFFKYGCSGQLARTSTNPTSPEVNDHVSLQWPSYEQPKSSNLKSQREQTF